MNPEEEPEEETALLHGLLSSKPDEEIITAIPGDHLWEWPLLLETATKQSDDGDLDLVLKIIQILAAEISRVAPSEEGKLGFILTTTCSNSKFMSVLTTLVTAWSQEVAKHEALEKLLSNLQVLSAEVLRRIPLLGKDVLLNLVCGCIGASVSASGLLAAHPEVLGEFTELQKRIQEINIAFEERKKVTENEFTSLDDLMLPPEDFREISIIPTLQDLITERPFLRPNKVVGSYRSSEHYLDVQFRLLREDFIRPLRYALQDFMRNREKFIETNGRRKVNREQDGGVKYYTDLTFLRTEKSRDNSLDYIFSLPKRLVSKVKWDKSKRLLPGCLVMLTSDYCQSNAAIFAVILPPPFDPRKEKLVSNGDPKRLELATGLLRVSIESGIELVKENASYLMFECETYFEAYRHNLGILQSLLFLENDGPEPNSLNTFIVKASQKVGHPLYLNNTELDLKLPIGSDDEAYVYPFRPDKWPAKLIQERMSLDPDQYEALKMALTSELAVIQGPPGTGKTYIGLQIVKTLVLNKKEGVVPRSPILILCYTNHAVDQFLELILQEMPDLTVVRVGGQCKSAKVEGHTLPQHRRRLCRRRYRNEYDDEDEDDDYFNHAQFVRVQKSEETAAFRVVKELENTLRLLKLEIAELSQPTGLIDFDNLEVGRSLNIVLPDCLWKAAQTPEWLAIRKENFQGLDFPLREIVSHLFEVKSKPTTCVNSKASVNAGGNIPQRTINRKSTEVISEMGQHIEHDNADEFLEHRIHEKNICVETEVKTIIDKRKNDVPEYYLQECSVKKCMDLTAEKMQVLNALYSQYRYLVRKIMSGGSSDSDVYSYERSLSSLQSRLVELEGSKVECLNRTNLLSVIFGLYNAGRLALPNLDKVFHEADNGLRYVVESTEIIRLPIRLKWGLYFKLVEIALKLARERRDEVEEKLVNARKAYSEARNKLDACILKDADVIGITTTGAAKMHQLLEFAKPEIVIAEEAAEILESHVVTSLTEDCKHLILIGDHFQLRPSVSIFELEKKYRLDVSLFERMILNGVPFCTLKTQHRMRPEISNLINGTIYPELFDHVKVREYPPVKGVNKSLFFITHQEKEDTDHDLLSKSNHFEAEFLVGLCDYLLKQGYEHKQITILTTYTGQMFLIKRLIPQSCRNVRITCVDNFQGEENDIILLSLVRSNDDDTVGFVRKDNRICVALSRAKHGMFVVANMDGMMKASKTWRKIHKKLKDGGNVGSALELICQRHGNANVASTGKNFFSLTNGGCGQICNGDLPCGHTCSLLCHAFDESHEQYKCNRRCLKTCELNHQCRELCSTKCHPCFMLVEKLLPCGHLANVACHQDVSKLKCRMLVEKLLTCGHARTVECDIPPEEVKCDVEEEKTLDCGHTRVVKCYQSMCEIRCDVIEERVLKCGHKKKLQCHLSVENAHCSETTNVVLKLCSHVQKRPCGSSATPKCSEKCGKKLPCGHKCQDNCHVNRNPNHWKYQCTQNCERSCDAGHPCKFSHQCHRKCFPCDVPVEVSLKCGHKIEVECKKKRELHKCTKKVKKMLPCGHDQFVMCHVAPAKHRCTFHITDCPKKCAYGHPCPFEHACYEDCTPCEEMIEKKLMCGHSALLHCNVSAFKHRCSVIVEKKLKCGHAKNLECCEPPGKIDCDELMQTRCTICGKKFSRKCFEEDTGICDICKANPAKPSGGPAGRSGGGRGRGIRQNITSRIDLASVVGRGKSN